MIETNRMGINDMDLLKKGTVNGQNREPEDFWGQIADKITEKDDYRRVSRYKQADRGEALFGKKSKDSFWERRMRHKKRMKELDKKRQARQWKMSEMQKKMFEKEMYYRSIVQRNRIKGEDTNAPERHLQELSMSYETSVLMNMLLENIGL